jgi:hypothetical protein
MYRRLSLFGVFGLDSDISVKDPNDVLVEIPRTTEEAERNHQNKVRRFMQLRLALQMNIHMKFRADKMDATFRYEIG